MCNKVTQILSHTRIVADAVTEITQQTACHICVLKRRQQQRHRGHSSVAHGELGTVVNNVAEVQELLD